MLREAKVGIYLRIVELTFQHGCELWMLNVHDCRMLDCLHSIFGVRASIKYEIDFIKSS